MFTNISITKNFLVDNFLNSIPQFDSLEVDVLTLQIENSVDNVFETIFNEQNDQLNSPINNSGAIATGQENDVIFGIADSLDNMIQTASSLGIINTGLIRTSVGNDTVIGSAETIIDTTQGLAQTRTIAIGIQNQGLIDTGDGDDQVLGIAKAQANSVNEIVSLGIINTGQTNTGIGNDTIIGKAIATNKNSTDQNDENTIAIGVQNQGFLQTGEGDDQILGIAEVKANSINKTINLGITNTGLIRTGIGNDTVIGNATSETIAISTNNLNTNDLGENELNTLAIGIQNRGLIETADGNDKIFGLATISNSGESIINSPIELSLDGLANSLALSTAVVEINTSALAIGIQNTGEIQTGKDNDQIIGIAQAESLINLEVNSEVNLELGNNSLAIANSEVTTNIGAFAIGLENQGQIGSGQGDDYLVGVAGALAINDLEVNTLARNIAISSVSDLNAIEEIEQIRTAQTNSVITGVSQTNSLGILNTGLIDSGIGNDLLLGLASSISSSNIETTSLAEAIAQDSAPTIADLDALAVGVSSAVGIGNSGKIATGKGHDMIIGISSNNSAADINFDTRAVSNSNMSNADSIIRVLADASEAIAIGIDNNSGLITTAEGDDRIIGLGNIGITGGTINTGRDDDSVVGYGDIGVAGSKIELGQGNDFFKAAIVTVDSLTGEILFSENQSGSIIDSSVWGGNGNDRFEIGGFAGNVVIDGGLDHDVFKLFGNFDDYEISLGSVDHQSLSIENSDSVLTIRNVEEFQFANSDRIYSYSDFA